MYEDFDPLRDLKHIEQLSLQTNQQLIQLILHQKDQSELFVAMTNQMKETAEILDQMKHEIALLRKYVVQRTTPCS